MKFLTKEDLKFGVSVWLVLIFFEYIWFGILTENNESLVAWLVLFVWTGLYIFTVLFLFQMIDIISYRALKSK